MQRVRLQVNGSEHDVMVEPQASLLAVLRDRLALTGTKEGCSTGYCGACTVLVDREPVNACLFFAVDADHRQVTTIDGLSDADGRLHPLQTSMMEAGGLQCGFCTPGVIMSAVGLLLAQPAPSEDDVRKAIAGNLCRCTGYQPIVEAILAAAPCVRKNGNPAAAKRRSRA